MYVSGCMGGNSFPNTQRHMTRQGKSSRTLPVLTALRPQLFVALCQNYVTRSPYDKTGILRKTVALGSGA